MRRRRKRKKSENKKVRGAQKQVYRGIKFQSRLELFTYKELKKAGIEFQYEKHRFELQEKFTYDGECIEKRKKKGKMIFEPLSKNIRAITYLPDFVNLKDRWIIEVKGLRTQSFDLRWKLFKKYLAKNGLNYDLYLPGNQSQVIESILNIKLKTKKK